MYAGLSSLVMAGQCPERLDDIKRSNYMPSGRWNKSYFAHWRSTGLCLITKLMIYSSHFTPEYSRRIKEINELEMIIRTPFIFEGA